MYVTPGISKEEAENIFSQRKSFLSKFGKKKPVPLKRVELIYLPFYLFEVISGSEDSERKVKISLDGLLGDNLFFFRESLKFKNSVDYPVCPFVLSPAEAQPRAADKYKWLQLEHRLRLKQKFEIGEISEGKRIFYPFWVGYFQRGKGYDFKIMDAVSGEVQGVRMRKVFLKALRHL
ncbi:MAG: hypothetical protein JSV88_03255 [Candidatus Aminicenantes bacterium]|nr:MAG: hypothetical protein JSV88_03255 [Candidatus Aminicenantes bacterium]